MQPTHVLDYQPCAHAPLRELHLFAGGGGGILASRLLGHRVVCAVEIAPYAASILVARQNDGFFAPFPIWDNICTFDGRPWRGHVDVVAGGFPCQDISSAGKGAGIDGERSGLWREFSRIIGEVRPLFAFVENSPMLTVRGLGRVLGDLAALGYDARWGVLGAADLGAPHQRERIWIVAADAIGQRCEQRQALSARPLLSKPDGIVVPDYPQWQTLDCGAGTLGAIMADANRLRCHQVEQHDRRGTLGQGTDGAAGQLAIHYGEPGWWQAEPALGRVADGVANRAHRLKALGNGQVPLCAATAWQILANDFQFLRA
ncbi:MAG: DNA cytosine methyltransferase [Verrucomicrobiales bacterium]|nr:DNA cytosine methyltransferase [Verrucomicrobiales bacterium]